MFFKEKSHTFSMFPTGIWTTKCSSPGGSRRANQTADMTPDITDGVVEEL